MRNINSFLLTALLVFVFPSCQKSVLEVEPEGQESIEKLFTSTDGAIQGINAAYERLGMLGSGEAALFHYLEEKSDNAYHGRSNFEWDRYTENSITAGIADSWSALFINIQRANTVLARLKNVPFKPAELANKLPESIEGQAYFVRALSYFWLVQLWGDVPLYTEEITDPLSEAKARSKTQDVYSLIKSDLNLAIQKLPLKTQLNNSKGFEKFRASKGAANALKAEVHLALGEWQAAAEAANQAIISKEFSLYATADYIKNFQGRDENGAESVFEIQYSADNPAPLGILFNGQTNWHGYPGLVFGQARFGSPATDDNQTIPFVGVRGDGLSQAFEAGDIRKDVAISTYGNKPNPINASGPSIWLCNKYYVSNLISERSFVNLPLIRYSKVLLTRAEALNEISAGNPEAKDIINNQIRKRAGLPALSDAVTGNQAEMRNAILKERRVEFCFEVQRYFDLLRTGTLVNQIQVKQGVIINATRISKHPITNKDIYLLPIPQNERDNNSKMTQNPGY